MTQANARTHELVSVSLGNALQTPRKDAKMAIRPREHAERRNASVTLERLKSLEAVLADGELTPPEKMKLLTQ